MNKTRMAALGLFVLGGAMSVACAQSRYNVGDEVPYNTGDAMPEGAGPGEAWCLYQYPAETATRMVRTKVRDEVTLIKPVPPEFGTRTEQYECKPAFEVGTASPTDFRPGRERYLFRPAHKVRRLIPAEWRTEQQEVVVQPAYVEECWEPAQFRKAVRSFEICPARDELQQVACVDGTNLDCFVTTRIPAQTQTVEVEEIAVAGRVVTRQVPEKKALVPVCVMVREEQIEVADVAEEWREYEVCTPIPAKVQVTTVPPKMFEVTSAYIKVPASTREEKLEAVYQDIPVTEIVREARIVWKLTRVGVAPATAAAPAPSAAILADESYENYGSVPGNVAAKPGRAPMFGRTR